MAKDRNINPERTGFLILLLIVTITAVNTWRSWPKPAIIEDARAEFSSPFTTTQLSADYQVEVSGRDPLVPPAVDYSREYDIKTTVAVKPPVTKITPPPTTTINPNLSYVMLPSKNAATSQTPQKTDDPKETEKPFPVRIKGIANFPDVGYRLVITDADGEYSRLAEGDEWEKDGDRLQIRKIYPTKVVFLNKEGKVHTLEFDPMGMHFKSDGSTATTPTSKSNAQPPEKTKPHPQPDKKEQAPKNNPQGQPSKPEKNNNSGLPQIPGLSKEDIQKLIKKFIPGSK